MDYLNIRLTQPQIDIHSQRARLDAHMTPARLSTPNRQARSNAGWTQPTVEINSYPSRHSYGFTNHTDFAREHGQQGYADVQKGTSGHTAQAWANIERSGKRGAKPIAEMFDQKISEEINRQRIIVAADIPDPEITYHPIEKRGTPDEGDVTIDIESPSPFAEVNYTPGSAETSVKQKAEVRQWITKDRYDKYV